jgi:hypothetical protein
MLTLYAACLLQLTASNIVGTYYQGGGTAATTLILSQEPRYELTLRTDLGTVTVERGGYRASGELIVFSPDLKPFELSPELLYIAPWGDVVYLIEPNQMVEFADLAHRRWKEQGPERQPFFFVKGEASGKRGSPVLPSRFRFIQEKGFVAKVLRVDGPKRVVVDKGSLAGLLEGSWLAQPEIGLSMLRVDRVSKYESVCEAVGKDIPLPAVGDHLFPLLSHALMPRRP